MRSEFDFIQNIKSTYRLDRVGDDCAVLPRDGRTDMVVTADLLIEDVDFRLEWTTGNFLGQKALAVSLSDIAAMGAEPKWAMLSIGVPERLWKTDFPNDFFAGFHRLAAKHSVEIIGGDVSKSPDKFVIDAVAAGEVPKAKSVLRSGAKPGHGIYVTGLLGGAAAGLRMLECGERYDSKLPAWKKALLLKQLRPLPSSVGVDLRKFGASAMIDLSDGLSSDLTHICNSSVVGARIYADLVPIERKIVGLKLTTDEKFDLAVNGGEDFELLFTIDEKKFPRKKNHRFHRIGEVTANVGIIELTRNGASEIFTPKGYRHF